MRLAQIGSLKRQLKPPDRPSRVTSRRARQIGAALGSRNVEFMRMPQIVHRRSRAAALRRPLSRAPVAPRASPSRWVAALDSGAMTERESRRTVTVLFADLVGSTSIGESLDPEALRVLQSRYFDSARVRHRAPRRHGREVHRRRGHGRVRLAHHPRGRCAARGPCGRRGAPRSRRAAGRTQPATRACTCASASTPGRWWRRPATRPTVPS